MLCLALLPAEVSLQSRRAVSSHFTSSTRTSNQPGTITPFTTPKQIPLPELVPEVLSLSTICVRMGSDRPRICGFIRAGWR